MLRTSFEILCLCLTFNYGLNQALIRGKPTSGFRNLQWQAVKTDNRKHFDKINWHEAEKPKNISSNYQVKIGEVFSDFSPKIKQSLNKNVYNDSQYKELEDERFNEINTIFNNAKLEHSDFFPDLFQSYHTMCKANVKSKGTKKNLENKHLTRLFDMVQNILNNSVLADTEDLKGNLDSMEIIKLMTKSFFPEEIKNDSMKLNETNVNSDVSEEFKNSSVTQNPNSERYAVEKGTVKVLIGKWNLEKGKDVQSNESEVNDNMIICSTKPSDETSESADTSFITSTLNLDDTNNPASITVETIDKNGDDFLKISRPASKESRKICNVKLLKNAKTQDHLIKTTQANYFNSEGITPFINILEFLEAFGLINDKNDPPYYEFPSTKSSNKIILDDRTTKRIGLNGRIDNIIETLYTIFPIAKDEYLNDSNLGDQVIKPFSEITFCKTTPMQNLLFLNENSPNKSTIMFQDLSGKSMENNSESSTISLVYDTISPTKSKAHLDLVKVFETVTPITQEGPIEFHKTISPYLKELPIANTSTQIHDNVRSTYQIPLFSNKNSSTPPLASSTQPMFSFPMTTVSNLLPGNNNFTPFLTNSPFQQTNISPVTLTRINSSVTLSYNLSTPAINPMATGPVHTSPVTYENPFGSKTIPNEITPTFKLNEANPTTQVTPLLDPKLDINSNVYTLIPEMITKILNSFTSIATQRTNTNSSIFDSSIDGKQNHINSSDKSLRKTNEVPDITNEDQKGHPLIKILEGETQNYNETNADEFYYEDSSITDSSSSGENSTLDSQIIFDFFTDNADSVNGSQEESFLDKKFKNSNSIKLNGKECSTTNNVECTCKLVNSTTSNKNTCQENKACEDLDKPTNQTKTTLPPKQSTTCCVENTTSCYTPSKTSLSTAKVCDQTCSCTCKQISTTRLSTGTKSGSTVPAGTVSNTSPKTTFSNNSKTSISSPISKTTDPCSSSNTTVTDANTSASTSTESCENTTGVSTTKNGFKGGRSTLFSTAWTSFKPTASSPVYKTKHPLLKYKTTKKLITPTVQETIKKFPTTELYNEMTHYTLMDDKTALTNIEDASRPTFSFRFEFKEKVDGKLTHTEETGLNIFSNSPSIKNDNFASTSLPDPALQEIYSDETTGNII